MFKHFHLWSPNGWSGRDGRVTEGTADRRWCHFRSGHCHVARAITQTLAKINRKRLKAKPMDGYGSSPRCWTTRWPGTPILVRMFTVVGEYIEHETVNVCFAVQSVFFLCTPKLMLNPVCYMHRFCDHLGCGWRRSLVDGLKDGGYGEVGFCCAVKLYRIC